MASRARQTLEGYERLPGSARRFRTPSGEIISRREYENRVFSAKGWENWREFQNRFGDRQYRLYLKAAARKQKKRVRDLAGADTELTRGYIQNRDAIKRGGSGPNSRAAKYLVWLGLRKESDRHDVGDTPPKKRRSR